MGLAAFATYSCMYAYRKSFSVGVFDGIYYLGLDFKSLLIIAQALGYMTSKFVGIKFISEMKKDNRPMMILGLIGISELGLILFAVIPQPYNFWCLFLNGLPLGMIWGIVFSYLEGRSTTEILGAILATSFILASNISKSVAQWLIIDLGVSEFQMPYIVGLLFTIPLLAAVFILNRMPDPTDTDIAHRMARKPMNGEDRKRNLQRIGILMTMIVFSYILLTIYRDLRSNYASDVWLALGFEKTPSIYVTTSLPSTLIVLVVMSLLFLIRNNVKALYSIQLIIFSGYLVIGISTLAFELGFLPGAAWVISVMTGVYLAYIPFNCFIFERIIPVFKLSGANIGFLMYIADAFGYLGSVGTLLYKNLVTPEVNWFEFIKGSSYLVSSIGLVTTLIIMIYQREKIRKLDKHTEKIETQMNLA